MQFYLCQPTSAPPQLSATQADAKRLDSKFDTIVLGDDKASRIAHINHLFAQAHATKTTSPVEETNEVAEVFITDVSTQKERPVRTGLPKDYRGGADDCPGCLRNHKAAEIAGRIGLRLAVGDVIDMFNPDDITKLRAALDEREADIAKAVAKAVVVTPASPSPRQRTRAHD